MWHLDLDSYKTPRSGIHESSWQFSFATRAWLKVDGSFMVFVSTWHVMTTVSQLISVFASNHESYKNIRQPKGLSSSSKGREEYVWAHHLVHLGSNWLEAFAPLMKPPMAPPTTFLSGHGMQSWHRRFGDAAPWMQLFGCDESTMIRISYEKLGGWIFWHKIDMCIFF